MSLNKVILIGNVGNDPEIRDLPDGSKVARFSLATSEKFRSKKSGELVEQTEWHNIVCWNVLAELSSNYIKKGGRIYLEGRIKSSSWADKITGDIKYSIEILANSIILLDRAEVAPMQKELTAQEIVLEANKEKPNLDELPF